MNGCKAVTGTSQSLPGRLHKPSGDCTHLHAACSTIGQSQACSQKRDYDSTQNAPIKAQSQELAGRDSATTQHGVVRRSHMDLQQYITLVQSGCVLQFRATTARNTLSRDSGSTPSPPRSRQLASFQQFPGCCPGPGEGREQQEPIHTICTSLDRPFERVGCVSFGFGANGAFVSPLH